MTKEELAKALCKCVHFNAGGRHGYEPYDADTIYELIDVQKLIKIITKKDASRKRDA